MKKQFISGLILLPLLFSNGYSQDRGIRIVVKTNDGQSIPLYQASHALIIGVSDYTNGWPQLPNAVKDAEEVARELEKNGFSVQLLKNPTKNQLENALNEFIYTMGVSPEDRLLLYFAGHGYTLKMTYGATMGYIVPADAPLPERDEVGFRRNAISMQTFENNARQIQSKHVMYLFDSCFSGSLFALSRAVPSAISYKTASAVRQFITAGDEGEEVPDKSVFKSQFLEGLKGDADLNKDGYVTGTELGEFLQTSVVNYSKETQHPQYGKIRDPKLDKGDFIFIINTIKPLADDNTKRYVDNSRSDDENSGKKLQVFNEVITKEDSSKITIDNSKPKDEIYLADNLILNEVINNIEMTKEWHYRLNSMKDDLSVLNSIVKSDDKTVSFKVISIQDFLLKYQEDIPETNMDNSIKDQLNNKLIDLEKPNKNNHNASSAKSSMFGIIVVTMIIPLVVLLISAL